MERNGTADAVASVSLDAGLLEAGLLDGVPRQRGLELTVTPVAVTPVTVTPVAVVAPEPVLVPIPVPGRAFWRLLPSPKGTPFTFWYAVLLVVTSWITMSFDDSWVDWLLEWSSTDVWHLLHAPVLVLVTSAMWVAGGLSSPFTLVFVLVLTALERRVGGVRTALIFALGHVLATLATEIPVGVAVLVGHLPESSLHRYDYGISFGVAASIGALAGLLRPWLGLPLLVLFGAELLQDLVELTDPLSNWGHLIALGIGVALWPRVRRWARERAGVRGAVPVS